MGCSSLRPARQPSAAPTRAPKQREPAGEQQRRLQLVPAGGGHAFDRGRAPLTADGLREHDAHFAQRLRRGRAGNALDHRADRLDGPASATSRRRARPRDATGYSTSPAALRTVERGKSRIVREGLHATRERFGIRGVAWRSRQLRRHDARVACARACSSSATRSRAARLARARPGAVHRRGAARRAAPCTTSVPSSTRRERGAGVFQFETDGIHSHVCGRMPCGAPAIPL